MVARIALEEAAVGVQVELGEVAGVAFAQFVDMLVGVR